MRLLHENKTSADAGRRRYRCGSVLTGVGSCFFLAGIFDVLLGTELEARQVFLAAGWFLTTGWLLQRWGAGWGRAAEWAMPVRMRILAAVLPLIIYLFLSGLVSFSAHESIVEAAYNGDLATVSRLGMFDKDLSRPGWEHHHTPLCAALTKGDCRIVVYLLRRGVDVNRPCNQGETPLKATLRSNHNGIAALLIDAGAHE